jgi:hypothetical protein
MTSDIHPSRDQTVTYQEKKVMLVVAPIIFLRLPYNFGIKFFMKIQLVL